MRSLPFFVIFRERKKERKKGGASTLFFVILKERKKDSCDMYLGTSKEKRKENREVVEKTDRHHNGTVSSVSEFACLAMYLLNLHWQQQERKRERERERERESEGENFNFESLNKIIDVCILVNK